MRASPCDRTPSDFLPARENEEMKNPLRGARRTRRTLRLTCCSALMLCATITSACGDSVSPSLGTLTGSVVLQDAWTNRLDDFSGVAVSVDGVSAGAVTDGTGAWHVDGVPYGPHDVTFKKSTFGTVRLSHQAVAAPSTTAPNVTMAITPWQQAVIDSVYLAPRGGKDSYVVDGHLSAVPTGLGLVFTVAFFGKTSAVSVDSTSFDVWSSSVTTTAKSATFSMSLPADVARSTFVSGQAFVTAYTSAFGCTCYPEQMTSSKPVYTNTGPRANVVQVSIK